MLFRGEKIQIDHIHRPSTIFHKACFTSTRDHIKFTCAMLITTCDHIKFTCGTFIVTCDHMNFTCYILIATCDHTKFTCGTFIATCDHMNFTCDHICEISVREIYLVIHPQTQFNSIFISLDTSTQLLVIFLECLFLL